MMRLSPRPAPVVLAALLLAAAIAGLLRPPASHGLDPGERPPASVVDGDSLQVGGRIVDLYGIDAPELGQHCLHDAGWQACGETAAFELRKLLALEQGELACAPVTRGWPARREICRIGRLDLGEVLVKAGYAMTTGDAELSYGEAEAGARQGRLGLWHSSFVNPADWRAGHRLPGEPAAASCPVKAVTAADGSRLYYVPTDEDYDLVMLDPARGDRAYCSDEAARAEGWRRPGEAG